MDSNSSLLPVPVHSHFDASNQRIIKTVPKKQRRVFLFFFALYLFSTLLGAALVPGRMEIEPESFVLSFTEIGASFFCTERCFFALFMFFSCFSFLKYPFSLAFATWEGVFTGIVIRLLMYLRGYIFTIAFALLTVCFIFSDIFISAFCFGYDNHSRKTPLMLIITLVIFLVYCAFSYLLSYLLFLFI